MSCLVPLIANAICLFQPSELRIEATASLQTGGSYHYYVNRRDMGSGILGRVSMTMTVPVSRRFEVRYGLEHTSLIETTADRGQERVSLGFVWRPL